VSHSRLLLALIVAIPAVLFGVLQRIRAPEPTIAPERMLPAESSVAMLLNGPRAWEQLRSLAQRDSWVKVAHDWLLNEWQLDFDRDVMPWAGRMAFSIDISNAFAPLVTGVIAIRDTRLAAETATRFRQSMENRGLQFRETEFEGTKIVATFGAAPMGPRAALQMGFGFAQTHGCLVIGNSEFAVRAALEVLHGRRRQPLVESAGWQALQRQLPPETPLLIAADLWTIMDRFAPLMPLAFAEPNGQPSKPADVRARIDRWKSLGWLSLALDPTNSHLRATLSGTSRSGPLRELLTALAESHVTNSSASPTKFEAYGLRLAFSLRGERSKPMLEWLGAMHPPTGAALSPLMATMTPGALPGVTELRLLPGDQGPLWQISAVTGAAGRTQPSGTAFVNLEKLAESYALGGKLLGILPEPALLQSLRRVGSINATLRATPAAFRLDIAFGGDLEQVYDLLVLLGGLSLFDGLLSAQVAEPPPPPVGAFPPAAPTPGRVPFGVLPPDALPANRAVAVTGGGGMMPAPSLSAPGGSTFGRTSEIR